jgi:protease II
LSDCCVVTWRAVSGSAVTNETRYMSADDPLGQPTVILPRVQDVEYGEVDCGGRKGKATAPLHHSPKQASQHPVLWKTGSKDMTGQSQAQTKRHRTHPLPQVTVCYCLDSFLIQHVRCTVLLGATPKPVVYVLSLLQTCRTTLAATTVCSSAAAVVRPPAGS